MRFHNFLKALLIAFLASCSSVKEAQDSLPERDLYSIEGRASKLIFEVRDTWTLLTDLKKNKETKLDSDWSNFLKGHPASLENAVADKFFLRDTRHIWNQRVYYERARALLHENDSPDRKAKILCEWIWLHVNESTRNNQQEDIGRIPSTVMWRGYGDSLSASFLFSELAHQANMLTVLYKIPSKNDEPHYVVLYEKPSGLGVADPNQGVVYADRSQVPYNFRDLLEDPLLLHNCLPFSDPSRSLNFSEGEVVRLYDPRSLSERFLQIDSELAGKIPAAYVRNYKVESTWLKQKLPKTKSTWTLHAGPLSWSRQWEGEKANFKLHILLGATQGRSPEGRVAQITAHPREALDHYAGSDKESVLDSFYRGQCYYELREFSSAYLEFKKTLSMSSVKHLHAVCHAFMARIEERLGNSKEAREHWLKAPNQERRRLALSE